MSPEEFVKRVLASYMQNKGIFINKVNAEELVPTAADDLHKALYLFYVLQLDYAMKSQILYKGAKELCVDHKDFFFPHNIRSLTDASLSSFMQKYLHPRYINEAIKRYRVNTDVLITKYGGDPRNIFNGSSAAEVMKRLKDFRGFGPKIGNFFFRTMVNTYRYSYPDIDEVLPPVDVHDIRIAYLLGFVDSPDMTHKNINNVKNIWSNACKEAGVSWLTFDKALWLIGSEGRPVTQEDVLALLG